MCQNRFLHTRYIPTYAQPGALGVHNMRLTNSKKKGKRGVHGGWKSYVLFAHSTFLSVFFFFLNSLLEIMFAQKQEWTSASSSTRMSPSVRPQKQAAPKALLRLSPDAGRGCQGGSRQSGAAGADSIIIPAGRRPRQRLG